MVFRKKKKVVEPKVNEEEIIDMPEGELTPDINEENSGEEYDVGSPEEAETPSESLEELREKIKLAEEAVVKAKEEEQEEDVIIAEEEKENLEEVPLEETPLEPVIDEVPKEVPQADVPQRLVYLTDGEAIRQILGEVQSLRMEVSALRYIIEKEIAK